MNEEEMNEEEKESFEFLKGVCKAGFNSRILGSYDLKNIANIIRKQQKEKEARIEEIKSLYKMISTKDEIIENLTEIVNNYVRRKKEELYISKDKIKEIIEKHKEFLFNELSKYEDDDNRKVVQYAITRLCFILTDIMKGE